MDKINGEKGLRNNTRYVRYIAMANIRDYVIGD